MTKQRLMLSAAMAALTAGAAAYSAARADTDITSETKSAIATASAGNITIEANGAITIKAATPVVSVNSSNSVANSGSISNTDTNNASGIVVDTGAGNLVSSSGIFNLGSINLTGTGGAKGALVIGGGGTLFAPITFSDVTSATTVGTSTTQSVQSSSVSVQGDNSYAVFFAQGTTIDGNMRLGGVMVMSPSKDSRVAGSTLIELDGNLQGNLVLANTFNAQNVGLSARGVAILGPISPCLDNASLSYTCATASTALVGGTTLGNVGAFVNSGQITVVGTAVPSVKGGNPEGGSAVVIANSIAGGFLNNGPATANGTTASAVITANGATVGGIAYPAFLIDPSQSITASNASIRGPVVLGAVPFSVDSVDGATSTRSGYGFINRGIIRVTPENFDTNSTTLIIEGSSPINSTTIQGGLLNTGSITATALTSVNTNSATSADTVTIGNYTTIPRIVVSGEETSSVTNTAGNIAAVVTGPGGGRATALGILDLANVPEIDILQHGSIAAQVSTSTFSPTAAIASTKTPFVQQAIAIIDASGSVKTINNAGSILAVVTTLTPAAGAVAASSVHAIDLLTGSAGGTTVNNSGQIQGDIFFNAGGGSNVLNVGNTGTGLSDNSGNANAGVARAQGFAVTNTPYVYATVSERILSSSAGFAPATDPNIISFGSGLGNVLHIGGYGYVNSVILSAPGGLDVAVDSNGQLFVANTQQTGSLNAKTFTVNGGTLGLTITQNSSSVTPVVLASDRATISSTASIGLQFGSFISSGTTSASAANPTAQTVILISAPHVTDAGLASQNAGLAQAIPFLFESPTESSAVPTPLSLGTSGGNETLKITLLPRSTGKTNADGTAGLNLSGAALKLFPRTAAALANDPDLGTAIATSLTVYNNNNGISSGINIAASQAQAQSIFAQFSPDVSGGARQTAVMITDQATGPIAARQRLLRSYGNGDGEMTLWGEEFAGMINNKGRFDAEGDLTTYKDHGFGFSLGMDAGSARGGWYGGALTFYSGDVIETLPRQSKTNLSWYMLTGYTDWHGRHVFLDTKLDIGYGGFNGKRTLIIGNQGRQAEGKRAGLLGALGATTGLFLNYGGFSIIPHISLDGMSMREEGYTEAGGGDGFDLDVAPYYANSARTFLGVDAKKNFNVFGASVSPEMRLGYRYDFVTAPVKLKAGFASTGGINGAGNSFTFVGPDPDTGNALLGFSLGAGTDTWHFGVNYDWIRGNNASTTQVGTLTLLGRI